MSKWRIGAAIFAVLVVLGGIQSCLGGGTKSATTSSPTATPALASKQLPPTAALPPTTGPTAAPKAPTAVPTKPVATASMARPASAAPTNTSATTPATAAASTTEVRSGGQVSEAEGEWVTSIARNATNYYSKSQVAKWQGLTPANRVWFRTLEDLLAAFPDRKAG